MVSNRLFVYGSLGPGRPNAHILEAIGGHWSKATAVGKLVHKGWGAELGFPGIQLEPADKADCQEVEGFVFESGQLASHWDSLDAFEGEAYKRVTTTARLSDGSSVQTCIYALA